MSEKMISKEKMDFTIDLLITMTVEEIAEEKSEVKVCKINVDEQPELAVKFRVMSIPTLILVKEGVEADRAVGSRSKGEILAFLGLQ